MPVEAAIRPVFQKPSTTGVPKVMTKYISATTGDKNESLDIQPPSGQTWIVNFARIVLVQLNSVTTCRAKILYYDSSTDVYISIANDDGAFTTVGEDVQVASFGNGPVVCTNIDYLRLNIEVTGISGSFEVHMIALVEEL